MPDMLHGRHPKVLELLEALGVPCSRHVRKFKIQGSVEELVTVEVEYATDAGMIDGQAIRRFHVIDVPVTEKTLDTKEAAKSLIA